MKIKIKDIPKNDRPRERLINNGVNTLSNSELLAIILKTGTYDASAHDLAINLLNKIECISNLKNITYEELIKIKGIGESKACNIISAVELSRRMTSPLDTINNLKITSSDIVFDYYKNIIGDSNQEHFYVIYLDNKKRVIRDKLLFIGTVNYSVVHPREIFREAYKLSASGIICIHNHPSNVSTPSIEDVELTNRLHEIGNLLGIKLIDHIVICSDNYYSFFENNKIN